MTEHHRTQASRHDNHSNPFVIPFILILVFAIIELYGGIWTKSLALLGDAWHMFSDVFALGLAMYAAHRVGKAKASNQNSRAELVASILNAVLMLFVTVWIVLEAVERLKNPHSVAGIYVMVIAFVGLAINIIVAKQLHAHEGEKGLNHQAALLHVMGDLLGSVAALASGAVVYFTGWLPIDPILSLLISLLLLIGTIGLIKSIWQTLTGKSVHSHHHDHQH
ncbi:MAG: cation diffusion facilitator family transporter [Methylophilus sp.]|nr:cation diffusion facilitator family transporter [Methylophilus sp.]